MKVHAASSLHDDEVGPLCNQPWPDPNDASSLELTAEVAEVTCEKCIELIGRES